jgi:hypothetical protein
MIANRLLVRWSFGWYEVTDTTGYTAEMFANPGTVDAGILDLSLWIDAPVVQEATLSLGSSQERDGMLMLARGQLSIFANPRTEIGADLAPVDETDTPYLSFRVGDKVTVPDIDGTPTVERVMALTVTESEDGEPSYAPELKDIILTDQERWQANLDKMANGTVSGQSKVASPTTDYSGMGTDCCTPVPPTGGGEV